VLLYNCPSGCPDILTGLVGVMEAATDPNCPKKRVLVTPDPQLDAPVAAAAWGATWKGRCVDAAARASLLAFVAANIGTRGRSPEPTVCADGLVAP
jgi:cytochrome oxidase Cu insertion factor (SCO1/SenC/PrrC family)